MASDTGITSQRVNPYLEIPPNSKQDPKKLRLADAITPDDGGSRRRAMTVVQLPSFDKVTDVFKSKSNGSLPSSPRSVVNTSLMIPSKSFRNIRNIPTIRVFDMKHSLTASDNSALTAFLQRIKKSYLDKYLVTHEKEFVLDALLSMYKKQPGHKALDKQISINDFLLSYPLVTNSFGLFRGIYRSLLLLGEQINANSKEIILDEGSSDHQTAASSSSGHSLGVATGDNALIDLGTSDVSIEDMITDDPIPTDLDRAKVQYTLIIEFISLWLESNLYSKDLIISESKLTVPKLITDKIIPLIEKHDCIAAEAIKRSYEKAVGSSLAGSGFPGIISIDATENGSINACAHDLNIMSIELLNKLDIADILDKTATKTNQAAASTWKAIIDHVNELAGLVTYSVLRGLTSINIDKGVIPDSKVKSANKKDSRIVMKFFSAVALKCLESNNFNTAWAIQMGLNHVRILHLITRMKLKVPENLQKLDLIFSFDDNWKSLRDRIKRDANKKIDIEGFFVLPLPIYSKDFSSIKENSLKVEDKYNLKSFVRIAHMIEDIVAMKNASARVQLSVKRTSISAMVKKLAEYDGNSDALFEKMADNVS